MSDLSKLRKIFIHRNRSDSKRTTVCTEQVNKALMTLFKDHRIKQAL